jgi:hypothetical protein
MHHASSVMLNLIQHPLIKQGIPNQVYNDVTPFRIKFGITFRR